MAFQYKVLYFTLSGDGYEIKLKVYSFNLTCCLNDSQDVSYIATYFEFGIYLIFINLGELQSHLQGMVNLIRDEDTMRLVSSHMNRNSEAMITIFRFMGQRRGFKIKLNLGLLTLD